MSKVEKFEHIRRDGKIILETMSSADVAKLGPIELVVQLRWVSGGKSVSISNHFGVWGVVVPGRNFIAATKAVDETRRCTKVDIFNSDGTVQHSISNTQMIKGREMVGRFFVV